MSRTWSTYQSEIFKTYNTTTKNLVISAAPGCLHPNTGVLMFDGSIKKAKDVVVGDILMGDDSLPRNVLSIASGQDNMYEVIPTKGESFVVNSKHILTVHNKYRARSMKIYKDTGYKTAIQDIPISFFIENKISMNGEYFTQYRLQRADTIIFKEKEVLIDPYIMGLWIGDGHRNTSTISNVDEEIINYLVDKGFKKRKDKTCWSIFYSENKGKGGNLYLNEFKKAQLNNEKRIPKNYLINSEEVRLKLLAGIVDSDGYISVSNLNIYSKWENLIDDINYLARSLGFSAYKSKAIRGIKSSGFKGEYFSSSISGDLSKIPTLLSRKRSEKRIKNKSVLRTGFKIKSLGYGEWNGFTVDRNNRFLLEDFTITHNSGKTTVIVELLKQTPVFKKSIFLCFNKSIADELSTKIPQNVKASTIHSLGIGMLYKSLGRKIKITEYKNFSLAKKNLKINHIKADKISAYIFMLSKTVDMYRINLGNSYDDLVQVNDKYGILDGEVDVQLAWELIECIDDYNNREDHSEFMVDFTDMLHLPIYFKDRMDFPKYDVVFVDEGQDLSILQKRLIDQIIKPRTGRFVLVGDQKQTIYTFIGANKQSFKEFVDAPNTIELPLSVSYRCPKKVIEEANRVFEGVEAFEGNIEGEVIRDGNIDEATDGDLILCRNNLPLAELFLSFLGQGKKAVIFGKDYEKGLLAILSKLNEDREVADQQMDQMLKDCENDLKARGVLSFFKHPKYQSLLERITIIRIISHRYDNIRDMESILDKMFSDDTSKGIILSTIHKMKGREADTVYFYQPTLIPSKYAETQEELYQERCLYYVCVTRSKRRLIYVN